MEYLSEREVVDVLEDFSSFTCSLMDILSQLRALQPRYYSIASSPVKVRHDILPDGGCVLWTVYAARRCYYLGYLNLYCHPILYLYIYKNAFTPI